jgi:hypothetical protein
MFTYLVLASLGLLLSLGAVFADRSVARHAPEYAQIQPAIPAVFFAAKTTGMMIMASGLAATVILACS